MSLLTRMEFAELAGISPSNVTEYKNRRKLVMDENGQFDTEDETNHAFLVKRSAKFKAKVKAALAVELPKPVKPKVEKPVPEPKEKRRPGRPTRAETNAKRLSLGQELLPEPKPKSPPKFGDKVDMGGMSLAELDLRIRLLQAVKIEKDIEKLGLDVSKRQGELIPYEIVTPLFKQHNHHLVTSFNDCIDTIIGDVLAGVELTLEQRAAINGKLTDAVNNAMRSATEMTANSLEDIVNEFADRRGRGQR
jgi:hypothetical protein